MTVIVDIDPNVRVRHNWTYASFGDIHGGAAHVDDIVHVHVEETDLHGVGRIVDVDWDKKLIYLEVDWASIRPGPLQAPTSVWTVIHPFAGAFWSRTPIVSGTVLSPEWHEQMPSPHVAPSDQAMPA